MIYRELHEEMGHLGVERVLDLARQRFFWPNMRKDIEHFIHHVCQCSKQKQSSRHTVALLPDPEVQTDDNRVVRRRQPPQRFTYYGPGNPAYISQVNGEKVEQYLPVHMDYTNQPFHLPHPPPPVFQWNPPIPPPYGIPPAIPQFWTPSYPPAPGTFRPIIPQPQFWNPYPTLPTVPLW